jgi:hypothetical protein
VVKLLNKINNRIELESVTNLERKMQLIIRINVLLFDVEFYFVVPR